MAISSDPAEIKVFIRALETQSNWDSSADFEALCHMLAEIWARENLTGPYRVEWRSNEPIDILISQSLEVTPPPTGAVAIIDDRHTEKRFFIECKLYGRNLDLRTLGAPYLYALKERPESLILATNKNLTSGALAFASWLFREEMKGTTSLHLWNPIETQENQVDVEPDRKAVGENLSGRSAPRVHSEGPSLLTWTLRKRQSFQDIPVARHGVPGRSLYQVGCDGRLVFTATLLNPVRGRKMKFASLRFDLKNGAPPVVVSLNLSDNLAHSRDVEAILEMGLFPPDLVLPSPSIEIQTSAGIDTISRLEGFPSIRVDPRIIQIPDLRAEATNEAFERWMRSDDKPVMLIQGEGGVGKTFLCGILAERARELGFQTAHSPLEVRTEPGFITEIAWLMFSPEVKSLLRSTDQELTRDLLRSLARRYRLSDADQDWTILSDLILSGQWDATNTEVLTQSLVKLMTGSGKPILFVISNAHRMADTVAEALRGLLGALESAEWGQVRLILEARDTPEDLGDAWSHLLSWIRSGIGHRVQRVSLDPLDDEGTRVQLRSVVSSTAPDEVAEIIHGKCGGNPLFLTSLMQSLLERDFIRPIGRVDESGKSWHVPSVSALRDAVADLGVKVEDILRSRIEFWHRETRTRNRDLDASLLGVMAVLGLELHVELLAILFGKSANQVEATLSDFILSGLVVRQPTGEISFSHEYIEAAALLWLNSQPGHSEIIRDIADRSVPLTGPEAYHLALSKGRVHLFLGRQPQALDAFNAALQFSGESFSKRVRCHQEIHTILGKGGSERQALQYHANFAEYLQHGYYIFPTERGVLLNEEALKALDGDGHRLLDQSYRLERMRWYRHNLSNLATRLLDLDLYAKHATASIDLASGSLAMAQILNRLVKVCGFWGKVALGREAGRVAASLESQHPREDDPNLPSVLRGELSFLYASIDPGAALALAREAYALSHTKRQHAHDVFARTSAFLRLHRLKDAEADINSLKSLVKSLNLRTLNLSLAMVEGMKCLLEQEPGPASDFFRRGLAEAAWQGNHREELRHASNLIVARALNGEHELAAHLLKAILPTVARIGTGKATDQLDKVFERAMAHIRRNGDWVVAMDAHPGLPAAPNQGPHMVAPILLNAKVLYDWKPILYPAPCVYGISDKQLEDLCQQDARTLPPSGETALGAPLYTIC